MWSQKLVLQNQKFKYFTNSGRNYINKMPRGRLSFFYSKEKDAADGRANSGTIVPFTDEHKQQTKVSDQSELPLEIIHRHLLDQIAEKGKYKSGLSPRVSISGEMSDVQDLPKTEVHVTVNVTDISFINPIEGTFNCKYRLYLFWEIDLHALKLDHIATKAQNSGHYYSLNEQELKMFNDLHIIPKVLLFNAMTLSETENEIPHMRVYGGDKGKTALLWNMSYSAVCREIFELQNFPFDSQDLTMVFRLNDPYTWDVYDLTVDVVQFHRNALTIPEWQVMAPRIRRDEPRHAVTHVHLQIRRKSMFYLQNTAFLSVILSFLGLLAFIVHEEALGERLVAVLTLILTVIAFKFTLSEELPKVPYNTVLDYLLLHSFVSLSIIAVLSLLPGIHVLEHMTESYYINLYCAYASLAVLVFPLIIWAMVAYRIVNRPTLTRPIQLVDNKNWYAFRFCRNPPYLQ